MQYFFLALFFFIIKSIRAFSQIGYEIKDLQETEFALFQKEAEQWKISFDGQLFDPLISKNTEGSPILGDPNVLKLCSAKTGYFYFDRIYTGLPPHKSVTFTAKFWYFDGGSGGVQRFIYINLNSNQEVRPRLSERKPETQFQAENQQYQVKFVYLNTRAYHEGSKLHLTIEFYKNDCDGSEKPDSLGIRELTLHLDEYEMTNRYLEDQCVMSQEAINLSNHQCSCPFGQALNEDSVCQNCSENCLNCLKSDPKQCVQCSSEMSWHGNECNSCHINCRGCAGPSFTECLGCNFGFYDYGKGTCLETCELPFKKVETEDGKRLCFPYCQQNEYFRKYSSLSFDCLTSCPAPLVPLTDNNGILICHYPCVDERDFLYPNHSCIATCPVPLVAEFDGSGGRFCKNPCESKSSYLYANRSCLGGCPAPLQIRSESIANFCVNPCHSKNLYLYQNSSCLPSCPFPGKTKEEFGVKYCLPPCRMTGEYILGNGSCSSECPAPLTRRTVISIGIFCLNPCETVDYFISANGSCLSNCPKYFETKIEYGGVKYCLSPCGDGQYYFEKNKTCLQTCPYPFKKTLEEGISLCEDPCSKSEKFIYEDQSCHEECPEPLIIDEEGNYCKSPCMIVNEYVNKDGDCQKICEYPDKVIRKRPYQICLPDEKRYQNSRMREIIKISNWVSEIGGILSGDPTSLLMLPLLNIFEQITMIDIKLRLSENLDHNIRTLGIICLIYILLTGIRRSQIHSIWSIFSLKIIGTNGDAILYLLLTTDDLQWSRILICITVILFTTFVGYKIICTNRSQEQSEKWRFLFETYQSNGLFMLIYILRMVLLSFIIGYLSQYPHVQRSIIVLMNLGMLLYLILGSPIQKKISYLQHLIIETTLFLYNGIFVILEIFDLKDDDVRNVSGQLMMILYLTASLITALIILLKLFYKTYHLLFKTHDALQAGHIQLREFSSQNSEETNESFEPQRVVNEVGFREINQEDSDAEEDNEIQADVVIE